jgi:protein-S-isoprenylcysteine O-methyltransferase Ste14
MMKPLTLWQIDLIAWYAFAAYWAITWLRVKRTKAREKSLDRLITLAVVVLAYNLLFASWMRVGWLRLRFVPEEFWIGWIGIALSFLGAGIAIWARYTIGEFWSARVTLKEGHQLIRSGPYAFVRHPIYTGMLTASLGTALVAGEWRGVVAVVLLLAAHSRKAIREESLLTSEFGEEYRFYRHSTGFLFPRLWPHAGIDTRAARS